MQRRDFAAPKPWLGGSRLGIFALRVDNCGYFRLRTRLTEAAHTLSSAATKRKEGNNKSYTFMDLLKADKCSACVRYEKICVCVCVCRSLVRVSHLNRCSSIARCRMAISALKYYSTRYSLLQNQPSWAPIVLLFACFCFLCRLRELPPDVGLLISILWVSSASSSSARGHRAEYGWLLRFHCLAADFRFLISIRFAFNKHMQQKTTAATTITSYW